MADTPEGVVPPPSAGTTTDPFAFAGGGRRRRNGATTSRRSCDDDAGSEDGVNSVEDSDDDDDDVPVRPYGRRSLAWTERYRKLNPYGTVRRRVLKFGHRSKSDWDECVASGQTGAYVPSRPDEMYAPEWTSWEEFLGLTRPYDETRHLAVRVLRLNSLDEYIMFVRSDPLRAEMLRIPVRPDLKYKDRWVDEEHFFRRDGDDDDDNGGGGGGAD